MDTKIERLNVERKGRIIAVSDIHGNVKYLDGLLKKIAFSQEDTLIIVGDMIEKGPESLKTVRYVLNLKERNPNVYATMGNVDVDRIGKFFDDSQEGNVDFLNALRWTRDVWERGIFLDMLEELGICLDEVSEENIADVKARIRNEYKKELDFLWRLPTILTIGNYIFVHAGIPTDSLEELENTEAFNYLKRDAFLESEVSFEKTVVVGHWPVCLYREDIDSMNPIFDVEKHIIAIDGGCALKIGAQLNALMIPDAFADIKETSFVAFDDYPVMIATRAQQAKEKTICIRYFDSKIEVIEELGDIVRVRHLSSGKEFMVPISYLYKKKTHCSDYTDVYLEVAKGDKLSVIEETSIGYIVKKDGIIGWYCMADDKYDRI